MEKNRDYCFRHAKMYEGWQCPMCADEEARRQAPAAAPTRSQAARPSSTGAARAEAPAGQTATRAESKAKSDQAEGMLVSGAAREALEMCESAIDMDRRNLAAHLVGARACRALRDTPREQELLAGALKLLGTDEYGRTSRWYIDVLKQLRDSQMVAQLARAFASTHQWPPDEALTMVKALVGRGAPWDAVVVLDALPASSRTLLTCAYSLQLTASPTPGVDPDLHRYLQSVTAPDRARVLAEMYEVQASDVLAGVTKAKVRDAVRTRYEEWTPEIKQLVSADARKAATERIAPKVNGPAANWAVRFFVGALVLAVVIVLIVGGGLAGVLVGGVIALGCAAAGFAYGRDVELKKLLPSVLPDVREEMTSREVERWAGVLSDDPIDAGAPPPAARPEVATQTCPYCANPTPADAAACTQCGRPLPSGEAEAAPRAEAPPDSPAAPASPDDARN